MVSIHIQSSPGIAAAVSWSTPGGPPPAAPVRLARAQAGCQAVSCGLLRKLGARPCPAGYCASWVPGRVLRATAQAGCQAVSCGLLRKLGARPCPAGYCAAASSRSASCGQLVQNTLPGT
jgi:hypothetical protein